MVKITLIEDWRRAHRFASIRVAAAFAFLLGIGPSLLGAWNSLPDDLKSALPNGTARWVSIAGFALCMLTRVTAFTKNHETGGPNDGAQ